MRHLAAAACVLGLAGTAAADTLVVPSEPYPTLQAAVDAAGTGDTIVLSAGTYGAGADIVGKTDLRIVGKGGPVLDLEGANGLDVTACSGIRISGITIQGANNGIYVYDSSDVVVSRVVLSAINYEAFGINGCQGVVVSRCTFTTVGGKGVEDGGSTGVVVDRCVFTDCGEGAVVLSPFAEPGLGSDGARVTRCVITGTGPAVTATGTGMVFDRNRFTVDGGLALDLDGLAGADGAVITRNIFSMTGTDRCLDFAGTGVVVSRNRSAGGGIIEQGSGNLLERNVIAGGDFGISTNGSGAVLRGNRVSDVQGNGLDLGGTALTVERNVVERCGNAGIASQVSGSTFTGNRVADAPYAFLVIYGGNTFSKNRATGTTTYDLWDQQVGGTNTYGTNAFRTTLFGD